jgi:ABC-type multidrug transport system fused ATPase/permease subunit
MTRGGDFVASRSWAERQSSSDVSAFLEEHLSGLPDLKSNGADAHAMRRFHERLSARFLGVRASVMAGAIFNAIVGMLFVLGAGGALGLSVALFAGGALSLGAVYAVFRYTSMLRQPLDRLTRQLNSFQTATAGIARARELLATRRHMTDGPGMELPKGPLSVELFHVSFAYDGNPVLSDISFRLEPGRVLGLVGRTGSGKTTISRLLFRLHDPVEGSVRLGEVDLRDVRLEAVRSRVALVTQDVQLFQGSLRENVTLFDESIRDERVCEILSELGLDAWVNELPDGLDTLLGAGGRGLSAGEAQLVALARVFLKDPGVVILDEASSRLDPHTEWLLERAISRLLDGRTGVVIAHRPATLQRCNSIFRVGLAEVVR